MNAVLEGPLERYEYEEVEEEAPVRPRTRDESEASGSRGREAAPPRPISEWGEPPLFGSALEAVRWALDDSRVALEQSSLYGATPGASGLAGYEAAGQAGIIQSRLRQLEEPRAAVIVADVVAVKLPCRRDCPHECCSGWRSNPAWNAAVEEIGRWWIAKYAPMFERPRLIHACVRRYFREHITMDALAKRHSTRRVVAVEVNGQIIRVLKPLKEAAWRQLTDLLTEAQLIPPRISGT